MSTVHNPWGMFCFVLQLILCLAQHNPQADVIKFKHGVNSTNSTSRSLNSSQADVIKHGVNSTNSTSRSLNSSQADVIKHCVNSTSSTSCSLNSPQADVIKHCVNSTNSTACCLTYEHVYKSLLKSENSFNISYALYPGGAKPSFLVRVNVYGPNKTHRSTPAMFTWSMHCLYANVPAWLLQILSLGSIFVTSRSQELNIQIPAVCCNISDDQKKREKIISGFLIRAQYELQDLAMSPGIRDPSLNTAECVIQGHKPDFGTSERSYHIRAVLWLSMIFVILSGPLLAKYIRDLEEL